ncbi:MAG: DJ-1/PfpI family protein [Gammaproteobacteria bacterium]|nr:DJ-1/PfpI family protein [Gammaproteobacteria bacterium]
MKRVLIPLAQGCEELEAVTLIDLLRRAGIDVTTAALDAKPVTCSRQTVIVADTTLDDILDQEFDLIVLPGGLPGADNLRDDERIIQLLKAQAEKNKYVAAICAAPKALAKAGLLAGKKATAFPGVLESLNLTSTTITNAAIEQDGHIITSRGPGTAMAFALSLISLLMGPEAAHTVSEQMQAQDFSGA